MKNFEATTANYLLQRIDYYYNLSLKYEDCEYLEMTRELIGISQVLFNLYGYSITETIDELNKIISTLKK